MNFVEYLTWESAQPERHEFDRGQVFAMADDTRGHHRIVVNLACRIDEHLDGSACELFSATMKLQIAEETCLYPDVMVTCGRALKNDAMTITEPMLVIDVLSPDTRGCDRRDKFILYRRLPSLRQYASIDPATRTIEVFTWTASGEWLLSDQTNRPALTLSCIDCELPVDWVFKGIDEAA